MTWASRRLRAAAANGDALSDQTIQELIAAAEELEKPKPRRRRAKSPFTGVSMSDVRALKRLAEAVSHWERKAEEGEFYLLPAAHHILKNSGTFTQMHMLDVLERHAWDRLALLPQYHEIREQHRVAHMKKWDSKAYESYLLRQELAEMRRRVDKIDTVDRAAHEGVLQA
ncbi:hypothetical protein ACFVAJ_17415 [Agromyces sp. NPDC057679]|uniref:hypothetical protein n=1 Tax=Agromyces sp. NPDC057679 TaxID=3346207 RepID=UPI00366BC79C